jgi:hypothetical protein
LRQIAFYEEPIENNSTISSQAILTGTQIQTDLGDNLLSETPFKHRKFKKFRDMELVMLFMPCGQKKGID